MKIIDIKPVNVSYLDKIVDFLLDFELYESAIPFLESAVEIDPNACVYWNNLAVCHKELENEEESDNCIEKRIVLKPKRAGTLYNIALFYLSHDQFGKADEYFKTILDLDSDSQEIYGAKLKTYELKFQYGNAISLLESHLEDHPHDPCEWDHLGDLYLKQHQYQLGINAYGKSLSINANNWITLNNLGVAYMNVGNFKSAVDCLKKALPFKILDRNTWNNLILAHRGMGNSQEAEMIKKKAQEFGIIV